MGTVQEDQARELAERIGGNGNAGKDLAWVVAVTVVLVAAAQVTGWVDRFFEWAGELSGANLNGVLALLVLIPVVTTVYAISRYRDAAEARDKLLDLATRDPLTGLLNRRVLDPTLDDLLRRSRRHNGRVAAIFVDLDGLKNVNDAYGHQVGDRLMVELTERMQRALGPNDVLIRYGGDEFVALCPDVTNAMSGERIAKALLRTLDNPFEFDTDLVRVSGSVGVAISEVRCVRGDEVLHDAEAALYQAKAEGVGRYAIFDRSMADQVTPSIAERRLRTALEKGEFRLLYQPIVSLWTKRMVGVEALLRWREPSRGLVPPDEFMAALESTGLIVPVGNWIVEEICAQSRRWQDAFPDRPAVNIKVNVSARQLAQANFVAHLRDALESSGAAPDRITLEISEGALMYDVSSAWSTLKEAKALGISLALDDFGTGYSSLAYLRQFNLDLLKIDQSFVEGVGRNREDTAIIEHVIGMAKAHGIVTVAEGVETEEQAIRLRAMNCDLAQGYYFSHPQPPDVIGALLAENGNRQEWRPPERRDGDDLGAASVVRLDRFANTPAT